MGTVPSVKPKKLVQLLKKHGFYEDHQNGSHLVLRIPTDPTLRVTVPMHNKDLKKKTLLAILKQAGLGKDLL